MLQYDDPIAIAIVLAAVLFVFSVILARFVFRINKIVDELERIRTALEALTGQPPDLQ